MGICLEVKGFRNTDGEFKKMLDMKNLCETDGFSYPKEVREYFSPIIEEIESGETLDNDYIKTEMLNIEIPKTEWHDDCSTGFEINVKDIPKECETIRVSMG